jgi:hypothetical protein
MMDKNREESPSLLLSGSQFSQRSGQRIHFDQLGLLGHVVEGSINRVEIKVVHLLEESGVKLFTIRYILRQYVTMLSVALIEKRR